MNKPTQSFVCSVCGKTHDGLRTDTAFTLPDIVWAISEEERDQRAKWTTDLCQMDEKYFIRCLLPIAFTDQPGYYGWGVWAQVEWPTFQRYLELYETDGTTEPPVTGVLANEIEAYGETIGLPVTIQFGSDSQRPTISFAESERHCLARETAVGMSYARYHEVLVTRGNK